MNEYIDPDDGGQEPIEEPVDGPPLPPSPFPADWRTGEPLIAVCSHRRNQKFAGVYAPGFVRDKERGAETYDWRHPPGSPQNTAKVTTAFEVGKARDLLTRKYERDSYILSYVLVGPDDRPLLWMPRCNKTGGGPEWLATLRCRMEHGCLIAEVDNPRPINASANFKQPWTPELDEKFQRLTELDIFRHAVIWKSKHGWRIFQPIEGTLTIEIFEACLRGYFAALLSFGVAIDRACKDGTRLQRVPYDLRWPDEYKQQNGLWVRNPEYYTKRDTEYFLTEPLDLSRMARIDARQFLPRFTVQVPGGPDRVVVDEPMVPDPAEEKLRRRRKLRAIRAGTAAVADWGEPTPGMLTWASAIGTAVLNCPTAQPGCYHELFMLVAGTLVQRGVPLECVPGIVGAAVTAAGLPDPEHHVQTARDTVARRDEGLAGYVQLFARWPEVAIVINLLTEAASTARTREEAEERTRTDRAKSLADTAEDIKNVYRSAPFERVLIESSCGAGKTSNLIEVVRETYAAAVAQADPETGKVKLPRGSKVALSVPNHRLALEAVAKAEGVHVPVRRLYNQAAHVGPDGKPTCKFVEAARGIAAGGQSVRETLCDGKNQAPCQYRETCAAYSGSDGPKDAPLVVSVHASIHQLSAAAGKTGLLAIDEPPRLVRSVALTLAQIDTALAHLGFFAQRYQLALAPALRSLRKYLETVGVVGDDVPVERAVAAGANTAGTLSVEVLRVALHAVGLPNVEGTSFARVALACARLAKRPQPDGKPAKPGPPPLALKAALMARAQPAFAARVGAASRVLGTLYEALEPGSEKVVRVVSTDGVRSLLVTGVDPQVGRVVRERVGPLVMMDAGARVHHAALQALVGQVTVKVFSVTDGAPIERVMLDRPRAKRSGWFDAATKKPVWGGYIAEDLAKAVCWALERPLNGKLALVTFLPVEAAMRRIRNPSDPEGIKLWNRTGMSDEDFADATEALAPILALWTGEIHFGHYGAIRGLNSFETAGVDLVISFGDPWENRDANDAEIEFLLRHVDRVPPELRAAFLQAVEALWKEKVRVELEQVHGRMRTIYRTREGRSCHVGSVLPGGYGWPNADIRHDTPGPTARVSKVMADAIRAMVAARGGPTRVAQGTGVGRTAVSNYMSGHRVPPQSWLDALGALPVTEGSTTVSEV